MTPSRDKQGQNDVFLTPSGRAHSSNALFLALMTAFRVVRVRAVSYLDTLLGPQLNT
jgi:hypothetical protein